MSEPISLFIADDNRLLREGLASMLAEQDDMVVIGAAESGLKAVTKIKELHPQVALIDIGMPGKDGIEVTQRCTRIFRHGGGFTCWHSLPIERSIGILQQTSALNKDLLRKRKKPHAGKKQHR